MKALIAASFLLAQPVFAADTNGPVGSWAGVGTQSGETWAMEVQFVPGGARVDYPDFPCGGVWIFDADTIVTTGTEWLTYGKQMCLDGLALSVDATGGGLRIIWIDDAGTEIANAELTRLDPPSSGKKSN